MSGQPLPTRPGWLIGTVENPFAPPTAFRARRLAKKVAAGAEFVQTQYVFDVGRFARWMAAVRALGSPSAATSSPAWARSARCGSLEFMRTAFPGSTCPTTSCAGSGAFPATKSPREGIDLCVETIQQLAEIAGVSRRAHHGLRL